MFIKPKNSEVKVPDPERKDFLPAEGREVAASPYWSRRLHDKDIEIVVPKLPKNQAKGE